MTANWLQRAIDEGRVSGLGAETGPKPAQRGGRGIRQHDEPNKTEARYAREVLDPQKRRGEIIDYWYQPVKFRLADKTYYTPDWMVMAADLTIRFVEVKGRSGDGPWVEDDAAVKFKVAARMYPFWFEVVWPAKAGGWESRR